MHDHSRKRGRSIAALAGAAVVAISLAACSGGGGDTEPDGPVTLDWWTWNPDQQTAVPYIEAFEAEHPDITIEHRFIQYSDYVNTVQLALTSGSGPDVFGLQVGALTEQFAPLAEDLAPAFADALGDDWSEQLFAADQLAFEDKQVAVPWMVTGGGLVWANQTLVDSLGLTVPETRADLDAFCDAVTAAGKTCIQQGGKDAWQNIDVFQTIANQIAPGLFYEALAGEASFDDPALVEAFETWQGLFDDGVFQDGALAATAYPDANDAFHKGEAAMMILGSWQNADTTQARLDQYVETYGDPAIAETQFVPYFAPAFVDGGTTGAMFGGPDVGFAVSASSDTKDAALTFVEWLTSSDEAQSMMAASMVQPALSSISIDLAEVKTDLQRTQLQEQEPAIADLIGQREIDSADVRTALGDALSAVASGQQSPADAAAAVQSTIDQG